MIMERVFKIYTNLEQCQKQTRKQAYQQTNTENSAWDKIMFVIKSEKIIQLVNKPGVYLLGGMELNCCPHPNPRKMGKT